MDEDMLPFGAPSPEAAISTAKPRRHRHVYDVRLPLALDASGDVNEDFACKCGAIQDPAASRRGKSSARLGKDQERRIEKVYGPTKIGERGDAVDHLGRVWKWQSKSTRAAPPLWLANIHEPRQLQRPVPRTISEPYRKMVGLYGGRQPVVIRSYVHVGVKTRDWLFVSEEDAAGELGLPFTSYGWWVIPGDWWLDHFGRDVP